MAPSTQRPAVILPRRQQGIEDCAKTCTVKSKSRSASSRPEAYQLANDRSWCKVDVQELTLVSSRIRRMLHVAGHFVGQPTPLILPDRQISEIAVKPILKKYFGFSEPESVLKPSPSRPTQGGASRSSRT
jgi:hypothetical protein